jgi:hypothetical protein
MNRPVDPVALLLRKGAYLDFAIPVPPPDKVLKSKVMKIVSTMSYSERIIAEARLAFLSEWINAAQSVLNEANTRQSEFIG